jgi:hypothetical protein
MFQGRHDANEVIPFQFQRLTPTRGQPVVGAAARVFDLLRGGRLGHQSLINQRREVAVKRPGLQRHPASRLLPHRLHDGVTVAVALGERQENVEDGGFEGLSHMHMSILDMSDSDGFPGGNVSGPPVFTVGAARA